MTPPSLDMTGRTVLVTGASSGLGARFARVLAQAGASVALAARRAEPLAGVQAEIEAAGGHALSVAMDVTDEGSVVAAFDAAEGALGPVDGVVANAGINVEASALEIQAEAFDALMAVNVRGVFLTAREGARRMIAGGSAEHGRGRIALVSSITATEVIPGLAPYSGSKAAVTQMGRVLARDWGRKGINVNVLQPGYVETDINADWFATEAGRRQIARWPRRRLMGPDALDGLILFLMSDASAYVTGAAFTADDGQSLA